MQKYLCLDDDVHLAKSQLICLENTLNGTIMPLEEIRYVAHCKVLNSKISKLAKQHALKLHLDGARLWNASVKTGISINQYAQHFDSVSLCLSKGMGAPIGSMLCGSKKFINRARHIRKLYGGGISA